MVTSGSFGPGPSRAAHRLFGRRYVVAAVVVALLAAIVAVIAGPPVAAVDAGPPFVTEWGRSPTGEDDLYHPERMAIGPAGTLLVADSYHHRVVEFTAEGQFVRAWGGSGTGPGQFSYPRDVAVDPLGNIYVTDGSTSYADGRVQVFDQDLNVLAEWRGPESNALYGIAVAANGEVYVADGGAITSGDGRVDRFAPDGTFIESFEGPDGRFEPRGVAIGAGGEVYVVDTDSDRIVEYTADGSIVRTWDVGSSFSDPKGIAVAADGSLYVATRTSAGIVVYTPEGVLVDEWGSPVGGVGVAVAPTGEVFVSTRDTSSNHPPDLDERIKRFTGTGELVAEWGTHAGDGRLNRPGAVAVAPSGDVYVADTFNDQVQQFGADGTFVRRWGSSGTGDGQFTRPQGVDVDIDGNVYVVEQGGSDFDSTRVQVFTADGTFVRKWGRKGTADGRFQGPEAIAVAPSGHVYVADTDNHRVQEFTADGSFVRKWGTSGSGNGQLRYPGGIVVAPTGNVLVADTYNHRVSEFTGTGTFVGTFGTGLDRPAGVAVDAAGSVYVVDRSSHVQQYSSAGEHLTQWGPTVGDGPGEFDEPHDIAVDAVGGLFVADTDNHRIQSFAPRGPNLVVTKTADETDVMPGDTIHFHVRIANTGDVPLTGVTVTDLVAPDCEGAVPDIAVDAVSTVDCEFVTGPADLGVVENVATIDTIETGPVESNSAEVTVSDFASPRFVRSWRASPTGLADGDPPPVGGITVDDAGDVWVAGDRHSRPVRAASRFDANGVFEDRWVDPAGPSTTTEPTGVAVAPTGEVYVSNDTTGVTRFAPDGTFDRLLSGSADGIAVAPDGTVYALKRSSWRVSKLVGDTFQTFVGGLNSDLRFPLGIATGPDGTVYVTDTGNHRVLAFAPDGTRVGEWGSEGSGNGEFSQASGIAVDDQGRVYVDDGARTQVFTADGAFLGKWSHHSNKMAVRAAADGTVHLFLGDATGNVNEWAFPTGPVVRVTLHTDVDHVEIGETVAYTAQVDNIGLDPLTGLSLQAPGLPACAGPIGDLAPGGSYVVECSYLATAADVGRLRRSVTVQTAQTGPVASNPTAVEVLGAVVATWGSPGSGPGQFDDPAGVAVAGDVFVADCGNDRIQRFTPQGAFVAEWGTSGTGNGQFDCPRDIARNGTSLLVVDRDNRRVQRFGLDGTFIESWTTGTIGDGVPTGIDVDGDGNVYLTDAETGYYGEPCYVFFCTFYPPPTGNNKLRTFAPDGTATGSWGGYPGLYAPNGLYVSSDGYVEVADTGSDQIEIRTTAGASVATLGLPGVYVYDVTEDGDHNIYVADRSHSRVRKYTPGGTYLAEWSVPSPRSLAVDGQGRLYVAGNNQVVVIDTVGATAPSRVQGTITESATPPAGAAQPASAEPGPSAVTGVGDPLEGMLVAAFGGPTGNIIRGTQTGGDGTFSVDVPANTYGVSFVDPTGGHVFERHDDTTDPTAFATFSVAEGQTVTVDAGLFAHTPPSPADPATISGTVTDPNGPVAGAWVVAVDSVGAPAQVAIADPDGAYSLTGLAPGDWRLIVVDPVGLHPVEWWQDGTDWPTATVVTVGPDGSATADPVLDTP